jgi:chemotaxis protein CheD
METIVRMGEAAASNAPGHVLACIGLGSCIGLALVDRGAGVAGLAHVMLPECIRPDPSQPHRFADLAVPALIDLVVAHGALRARLQAALAGGAAMFDFGGGGQDIGARNEAVVTRMLEAHRVPVAAVTTGGSRGRTIRVTAGRDLSITVREAGGTEQYLIGAAAHAVAA